MSQARLKRLVSDELFLSQSQGAGMRNKACIAVFLVWRMMTIANAQPGNFGAIAGGPVSLLVSNKSVQDDLKLTDEQIFKVKDWSTDMRSKAAEIRKEKGVGFGGKGGIGFTPLTPEQLEKNAVANDEIRRVSYLDLSEVLKNQQIERLKQIDRQNMGLAAFTNTEVVVALSLTDTQKKSVKEFAEKLTKSRNEILREALAGGIDPDKVQNAAKNLRKVENQQLANAVALLTDEQKKKWKMLTGEPFDLQKLVTQFPKKKE
jgi:hypothetical protein